MKGDFPPVEEMSAEARVEALRRLDDSHKLYPLFGARREEGVRYLGVRRSTSAQDR